ncbi:MAG: class I SAM-dependent methyltransferase [Acidobacteriota bacterium]
MEGWHGWDDYAAFYDWENAQTMGRRDVRFWERLAGRAGGLTLELGCGTGRVTLPMARHGARVVGIDRSPSMLSRARKRARRSKLAGSLSLVRGDIRALPFGPATFALVAAPYGVLQSLLDDVALDDSLASAHRVLAPGGRLAIDLVSDLPSWHEYEGRTKLRGRKGSSQAHLTLIESVRQDRDRGLTMFEQEFIERRSRDARTHRFALTFRTVSVEGMSARLEGAGFCVDSVLGDYEGGPWDPRADVWLILASRPARRRRPGG